MLLAIDTASRNISIALHDGNTVIAEHTWRTANHHTVELPPALDSMFRQVGKSPAELSALAVMVGPGSYTGLRIGMSLAKGIALSATPVLPLIGVSTLDVTAFPQPHRAEFLYAIAQAGRGRVNAVLYRWCEDGWCAQGQPVVVTFQGLVAQVTEPTQFAGEIDGAGREVLASAGKNVIIAEPALNLRRAGFLAEIAYRRFRAGDISPAAELAPTYPDVN